MIRPTILGMGALSLLTACASSKGGASSSTDALMLTTGEFEVSAADESFECHYTSVTTDHQLNVNSSHGMQGKGGHHVVVFYTDAPKPVGHHPCTDQEMTDWHQVAGSAGQDITANQVRLPDGFALKVPAGKQIVIQTHYINPTGKAMKVTDWVALNLIKTENVKSFANQFVLNDDQFVIAPRAKLERSNTCTVGRDLQIVLLLGHMHENGAHYKLERVDAQGAPLETLYEQNWEASYASHPPTTAYAPDKPLRLPKGTHLRQTCTWQNGTTDELKFPREMCVAYGFYFPDDGALECAMEYKN